MSPTTGHQHHVSSSHDPHNHNNNPTWRSNNQITSGSDGGVGGVGKHLVGATSLSDSSSSPVEPIKPLLDLSLGDPNGSLTVPLHPVFDEAAPHNVSSMASNTAYLHCLVHNLGNKSVSWIRQRDIHIMTVGRYTYTTDQRFEVINSHGSKDWILKIKYAQVRDSGNYECQVSTKPVRSYVVHLNVFEPQARIIGSPDIHVDMGSAINLTCIIRDSPEPPTYIFWYHNGKVLSFESPRGDISMVTDRGNSTTGYLLIQDAQAPDTGNYTCAPSNTATATVRVHVLNGETPAAMQTNGADSSLSVAPHLLLALCFLLLLRNTTLLPALSTSQENTYTAHGLIRSIYTASPSGLDWVKHRCAHVDDNTSLPTGFAR
ncbi:hypothetical protein Pcinc_034300 [Petrolisthes cinctipes]|uniref:Ig-like domain-containing protein n=1 Tax=Petrolisthes cinctipes TaxID=88211 RepID=A0AAE1JZF6_PETCI|nr:hypothetical protein Pcinc_034300 [Petrolisthes cinctipes]